MILLTEEEQFISTSIKKLKDRAGVKLGLFNLLNQQPLSAEEIAQKLQSNPSFTQSFLETCVVLGLIHKEKEQYQNSSETSEFLVLGQPKYIGDHILHITNSWNTWGNLDQLIREGQTQLPFENGFVDANTYWTDCTFFSRRKESPISN